MNLRPIAYKATTLTAELHPHGVVRLENCVIFTLFFAVSDRIYDWGVNARSNTIFFSCPSHKNCTTICSFFDPCCILHIRILSSIIPERLIDFFFSASYRTICCETIERHFIHNHFIFSIVAHPVGLEPTTLGLEGRCSIQLS